MTLDNGALVTGRTSHEVYLIENGKRRWVPDTWTMNARGLSPAQLQIVSDEELLKIPKGDAFSSEVPPVPIVEGKYYETDSGVFLASKGKLVRVLDPSALAFSENFDGSDVTYLPDSLVRAHFSKEVAEYL